MDRITNKQEIFNWKKSRREKFLGNAAVIILFSGFLLAGAGGLWSMTAVPLSNIIQSKIWVKTPAVIKTSEVIIHDEPECNTFSPRISFSYLFGGREHSSIQYNFNERTSTKYKSVQVVNKYPVGLKTFCFVNPDSPGKAVLNRELFSELLWGLLPLTFFLIGGTLPVFAIIYHLNKKKMNSLICSNQLDESCTKYFSPIKIQQVNESEFSLTPSFRRRMFFLGILFFMLFWNGVITSFVVNEYYSYLLSGIPDWFAICFLCPFVIIGFFLILAVVKYYSALFSPSPILTLNNVLLHSGEDLEIRWLFNRNFKSLLNLKFTLKGIEKSSTESDSDTTEEHTFHDKVLFESDLKNEMESGTIITNIPEHLMHSMDLNSNKIEWELIIQGKVHYFPDIKDRFPIIVLPRKEI